MNESMGFDGESNMDWELSADNLLNRQVIYPFPLLDIFSISWSQYNMIDKIRDETEQNIDKLIDLTEFTPKEAAILCLLIHHAGFTPADFSL